MSAEGESNLKEILIGQLNSDFILLSEISGVSDFYNKKIKIDILAYPKEHLVDNGFDPEWFGVEIKHFDKPGDSGKLSRFIWQAITYQHAIYNLKNTIIKPLFVLCFSNYESMNAHNDSSYPKYFPGMMLIAGLGRVGNLVVFGKDKPGWRIRFATSTYFTKIAGEYKRLPYNIEKTNAGNCL